MSNLPATQESLVQGEYGAHIKPFLTSYLNVIGFSVLIAVAGVVAGLEQGRKPTFDPVVKQEEAKVSEHQLKITALREAVQKFVPPKEFIDFRVDEVENGVEIHFGTANVFKRGLADLQKEMVEPMFFLGKTVAEAAPDYKIQIEGYTDDSPMAKCAITFPSNWELSGARAAKVLRVFQKAGLSADNMTFSGKGESQALYPNRSPAGKPIFKNRMKNRRLMIRITI